MTISKKPRPSNYNSISEEVRHSIGRVLDTYMVSKIGKAGGTEIEVGVAIGLVGALVEVCSTTEFISLCKSLGMHPDEAREVIEETPLSQGLYSKIMDNLSEFYLKTDALRNRGNESS